MHLLFGLKCCAKYFLVHLGVYVSKIFIKADERVPKRGKTLNGVAVAGPLFYYVDMVPGAERCAP